MVEVAAIWRHPIKSHGRETLNRVPLTAGQTMPWDRRWAVAHELSKADESAWSPCANFNRGSKVAALMAINASSHPEAGTVTLTHPDRPALTFDPDTEAETFLEWVRPLMPANRAQSVRVIRVPGRGMTDTDYPSVSLLNPASNKALSDAMETDLSIQRWRGNIVMSGLPAWEEFNWIGRRIRIGGAELEVRERIERCKATTANPETGICDADTLGALNHVFGHQDFGVYAVVTKSGEIATGDGIELL
ncbi:MAG: MOSC domain-containing protein [Pseudomonadota bacterium]